MIILLFISIAINIQVALPCIIWLFPELESGHIPDFDDDCCKEKQIGSDLYSFVERNPETSHFECNSNCVYEKNDQPNSRYCFKSGGKEYPICDYSVKIKWYEGMEMVYKCVNPGSIVEFEKKEKEINVCSNDGCNETPYKFTPEDIGSYNFTFSLGSGTTKAVIVVADNCTCPSAGEDNHEWSNALSVVKENLAIILEDSYHQVDKYIRIMTAFFKLNFLVLSPSQEEVFYHSKPCSPLRINCRLCCTLLATAPMACIQGNPVCKQRKDDAFKMCKKCLCELSKACFPMTECPQDSAPMDQPIEESHHLHACDRDCGYKTTPMKCVFNFKLEMLYSGDSGTILDGRRRPVIAYNGMIPGPPIVICEGDELVVHLKNNINRTMANIDGSDSTTTLHFHGIREIDKPWSDGVPHVTQCPIPPGGNFTYRFHARHYPGAPQGTYDQAGTYWYHSHVGEQRTNGAYGALIIRPNKTAQENEFQNQDSKNTIILQEWYESPVDKTIQSLLINGHGRIDNGSTSTYMEYDVDFDTKSLFRVIGAISEDVPLRLSIDEHTFKAISADAEDIEPVLNLNYLWIAAGERFDIVIQTKTKTAIKKDAYKIRVLGYANPNGPKVGPTQRSGPLCTIAWLKYPGQNVANEYVTDSGCTDFIFSSSGRTLNSVPIDHAEWSNGLNYTEAEKGDMPGQIFINALRAKVQSPGLDFFGQSLLNTQYIEFDGQTFNGISMKYNDVPLLLHDEIQKEDVCGTVCDFNVYPTRNLTYALKQKYLTTNCSHIGCTGEFCSCQHVLQQVYAPGYWTEIVLINNKLNDTPSHPIHQHGGWYRIVGMGKYDFDINRDFIMEKDKDCNLVPYYTAKKNNSKAQCLPRNLDFPPAKDTIQVPPGGYVILRTRADNKGAWIMHCHINRHLQGGMAMIYQVGNVIGKTILLQDWCTGHLEKGESCPPRPLGSANIAWSLDMENVERCVAPGTSVIFEVEGYHNVIELTEENYNNCTVNSDEDFEGEYKWTAPSEEKTYYLACGIGNGRHCKDHGMNAKIIVSKHCAK